VAQFYPNFSHRSLWKLQKVIGVGLWRVDAPRGELGANLDDLATRVKVNQIYWKKHEKHVDAMTAWSFKIEHHCLALAEPFPEHETAKPLKKTFGQPYFPGYGFSGIAIYQRDLLLQGTTSNMF